MAGALGLEPRSTVLETVALPLNYAPMERKTRFELATPSLARRCSTTELFPHWRPGWDSNPRPPPWQGGILTNWTTGPMSVCLTVIYITIRFAFWQEVFFKNFRESFFSDEKGAFLQSRFVFEYHQKLHHSQTGAAVVESYNKFEYHQKLHHSQTAMGVTLSSAAFEYHQKLHHSQTLTLALVGSPKFEYHQKLHHSQTKFILT